MKKMINPTELQYVLMARIVHLRDHLVTGNPATDLECPEALLLMDMAYISHAVELPAALPVGCRTELGLVGGAAAGQTQVTRWGWM